MEEDKNAKKGKKFTSRERKILENLIQNEQLLVFTKNKDKFNWKVILPAFPGRSKIQLLRLLYREKSKSLYYTDKKTIKKTFFDCLRNNFSKYQQERTESQHISYVHSLKSLKTSSMNSTKTKYPKRAINSINSIKSLQKQKMTSMTKMQKMPTLLTLHEETLVFEEKICQKVIISSIFLETAKNLFPNVNSLILNKEVISTVLYKIYFTNYYHEQEELMRKFSYDQYKLDFSAMGGKNCKHDGDNAGFYLNNDETKIDQDNDLKFVFIKNFKKKDEFEISVHSNKSRHSLYFQKYDTSPIEFSNFDKLK